MKIAVIVPTLNNQAQGYEALASIQTEFQWEPFIIPNWKYKWCLSKAWNEGIMRALAKGYDHFLVINDDILMSPYSIDQMALELERNDGCVMVTPTNVRGSISIDEFENISVNFFPPEDYLHPSPDFSCFLINEETWVNIGMFDENFKPAYFEDNDYHRRILLADKKALRATNIPFYHYGSQTQNKDVFNPAVPSILFELNRAYYFRKWGGFPGGETYSYPYNDSNIPINLWTPNLN